MYQSSHIHPLYHQHHRQRHRTPLPGSRIQVVRNTGQSNIRQRPTIHGSLLQSIMSMPWNRPQHLHGISPPNRWFIRTKEPMGGAIPPNCHQRVTRRLERLAIYSHRSTQPLPEHHYTNHPSRSHAWVYPENDVRTPLSTNQRPTHR
jgi:hypothetical protein